MQFWIHYPPPEIIQAARIYMKRGPTFIELYGGPAGRIGTHRTIAARRLGLKKLFQRFKEIGGG